MSDKSRRKKQRADRGLDEHDFLTNDGGEIGDDIVNEQDKFYDQERLQLHDSKMKADAKANKKFSTLLVKRAAADDQWEDHDLASLVILISKELSMTSKKILQLLRDCDICTPVVLTTLSDSEITFTADQIIGALYDQAGHVDKFIAVIEDAMEQKLLNIKDKETLESVSISHQCCISQ